MNVQALELGTVALMGNNAITDCDGRDWDHLRYHMEVDKLKLKFNWLSLEIMAFSFK